jgi:hypothetical protein
MSEHKRTLEIDEIGASHERDFRILDASYDPRVAKITHELVEGIQTMGSVMLEHMFEAEAVAHDHDIYINEVDVACTLLVNRSLREYRGEA